METPMAFRIATMLPSHLGSRAHIVGPGAVSGPPGTLLQPDVPVDPSRFSPQIDWARVTEHWLAIEVPSRSSRIYDREFTRDAYFALGAGEVWLVDILDHSVELGPSPARHATKKPAHRPPIHCVVRISLVKLPASI
jgi:hypothetical protein